MNGGGVQETHTLQDSRADDMNSRPIRVSHDFCPMISVRWFLGKELVKIPALQFTKL